MDTIQLFNNSGKRLYLTPDEREQFVKRAMKLKKTIEALFCKFLYYTGARVSEALSIKSDQIDLEHNSVIIKTLKQGKKKSRFRNIPLPESFINELCLVFRLRDIKTKPFLIFNIGRTKAWSLVKSVMTEIGIKGPQATPKGLRHGFGVACVVKNINILTIQKWLGHTNIKHTGVYTNVLGNEERKVAQQLWD